MRHGLGSAAPLAIGRVDARSRLVQDPGERERRAGIGATPASRGRTPTLDPTDEIIRMNSGGSALPAGDAVDRRSRATRHCPSPRRNRATSVDSPDRHIDAATRRLRDRRTRCSRRPAGRPARRRRCPEFSVPVAHSTPSSPLARATRAVRSKLRPPIAAAACAGIGDIGGRYTYRRLVGCGDRSRKRAPNNSIRRSSSGNTSWRSASVHHNPISSCNLSGVRRGQVVALRPSAAGRRAPTARCRSPLRRCACRRPSSGDRSGSHERAASASSRSTATCWSARRARVGERRGKRVPGDRKLLHAVEHLGRRDAEQVVDRRRDVGRR